MSATAFIRSRNYQANKEKIEKQNSVDATVSPIITPEGNIIQNQPKDGELIDKPKKQRKKLDD